MGLSVDIEKKLKEFTLSVSFNTEDTGGITGILGASGCGKSMTLKCIAGIATPDKGRIVLNGKVLYDSEAGINLKPQERRVGYLFQDYALFPHMTVLENVEFALQGTRREKREIAEKYLKFFHVDELLEYYPTKLSGGQQQRVALARIMAFQPDVLLLDEPFSALDYYMKENLQLDLTEELKGYGGDVLLVTHDRNELYRLCETIHVLDRGKLVASGSVKEVFNNPQVIAAARITGCKNIVRIKRVSEHEFQVPQWNTIIRIRKILPEQAEYIGVRAHYLRRPCPGETENVMPFVCKNILEDPFEITLILEHGIWWKIPKETWKKEFEGNLPENYVIPEESLLFLREHI